ncbi:GspH/FimT family pseudopilin [Arenimonas sp.]|uniref:GspH/FimT family pseudopilin n=1 Tax=Arenimonas sp. TaxID=1872635 RepID=UPI0039E508DB
MTLSRPSGFTLIELMVTVAIVSILLIVAVPSFQTVMNSNRLTTAANEFVGAVQLGRAEAIRNNRRVVLCLSTNPNAAAASVACAADNSTNATGWIVFVDTNTNGAYNNGTDRLLRVAAPAAGVRILGSSNLAGKVRIDFRSDGLARRSTGTVLSGTVSMCLPTGRPAENVRNVNIRGGGVVVTRADGNKLCAEPGNAL